MGVISLRSANALDALKRAFAIQSEECATVIEVWDYSC
jgi:hypothetical protein